MIRIANCMFVLSMAALGTAAAAGPSSQASLAGIPDVSFPAPHRIAAGALQQDDMATLQHAGVKEVINLRAPAETPGFDEAAAMREAGITYHDLPIRGPDDLTRDNVHRFDELLARAGDRLTLVHCASGNRVGALIALRAGILEGHSIDAAIAEGRRWGLKKLEPAARERLNTWSTPQAGMP